MSIRLLSTWNGYPVGTILDSGDVATEAALVTTGIATRNLTSGTVYTPNAPYGRTPVQAVVQDLTGNLVGRNRPRFALIGNSIAAQAGPGYAANYSYEFYSSFYWAMTFAGHPFQPSFVSQRQTLPSGAVMGDGIYGFSGAPSNLIAGDLPTFFSTAGNIDVAFIQAMENDNVPANAALYKRSYDSIIEQCLTAGAKTIYWNQFLPNTGITNAAHYWDLVKYMEAKAATVPQLRIVPTYNLYTDSAAAVPSPLNTGAFANATDGTVHPRKYARYLGQRMSEMLAADGWTYARAVDLPSAGAAGFIGGSGNMVGSGGTFGGGFSGTPATPPTGISLTNTLTGVTTATANATRWKGRPSLQIDVGASAQAGINNAFQMLMSPITTGFAPGDVCQFVMEVVFDSAVPVTGVRGLNLEMRGAGTVFSAFAFRHPSAEAYNEDLPTDTPLMYATAPMIVPAGTTSLRPLATALSDSTNAVALRMHALSFRLVNLSVQA